MLERPHQNGCEAILALKPIALLSFLQISTARQRVIEGGGGVPGPPRLTSESTVIGYCRRDSND